MPTANYRVDAARRRLFTALAHLAGESMSADGAAREILDRAFSFVGVLATDGMVLLVNRSAYERTGLTEESVIGLPAWEASCWPADGDVRGRLRAGIAAAAAGAFVRYETTLLARDQRLTIDLTLTPLSAAGGETLLIIAEGRDVTERERSDAALRESEERFHGIVSLAADAIISIDGEQRITLFNQGAERIFGYQAQEVLGKTLDLLLPRDLGDAHRREVRAFGESPVVARRMGERRQIFGRRRSGEVFPAEASISKNTVFGQLVFTAVLRDISDRWAHEAERDQLLVAARESRDAAETARDEAQRAHDRARFLGEASDAFSASLGLEQTITTVSKLVAPRLADLCLIDLVNDDGTVTRIDAQHARPDMQPLAETLWRYPNSRARSFIAEDVVRRGQPLLRVEMTDDDLRTIANDDEHLTALRALGLASCLCVPLLARGGTLGAITLLRHAGSAFYDTRDLSLAEELAARAALAIDNALLLQQAREAAGLRDQVLGIVSHDLRNPLSVIGMCASALKRGAGEPLVDRMQLAETIHGSVDWMQRLISDLLDISSIEAGRLSINPVAVDPRLVAERAAALFEPIAADKAIHLAADLADGLPSVRGDEQRIAQVLGNLLGNAIKFTDAGGRITIDASDHGDAVMFSVRDTGVGVRADDVPHLFERFWQARRGRSGSNGLGLAISKGIIEAHGGAIWVESVQGEGSAFRFTLPAVRDGAVHPT